MKRIIWGLIILGLVGLLFGSGPVQARSSSRHYTTPSTPLPDWSQYEWEVEHKVKAGEFLFMLAGYYYQDGRKWNWIYETNRDKIRNPNRIKPGQVLIIKVPKNWEPVMPYNVWFERTKEESAGYAATAKPYSTAETPKATINPKTYKSKVENYVNQPGSLVPEGGGTSP
jgi:hypothetical protein